MNAKNSELYVAKDKRRFLTYKTDGLADCTLEELEDGVSFVFDTEGTEPAAKVKTLERHEQFRFLYNCAGLLPLAREYGFGLSLDNIVVDVNLMPRILMRDAKNDGECDFPIKYKALIGSVLFPKYGYGDYINGGHDLYAKNGLLAEIVQLGDVSSIKERMLSEHLGAVRAAKENRLSVNRSVYRFQRTALPAFALAAAALALFAGRLFFFELPYRESVIEAGFAYIHGDHLRVQRALRNYGTGRMSDETKHILSRSYVATEALTHTQITNILLGLGRITDPIVFEYWIHLGRLYFEQAVDIAQRLGDDELLLFAYLKQEIYVRNDMTLTGAERAALLSELENHIDRLTRAREEAAGNPAGN